MKAIIFIILTFHIFSITSNQLSFQRHGLDTPLNRFIYGFERAGLKFETRA